MEKPMNSDADRAARAQADSVTAPARPSKPLPYEPTSAMLIAAREQDPALPIEMVRAIYWAMWRKAPTQPAQAADSVQDLQPVHDAVTIDLLNERVAYLERKLKEADSVLEDAARDVLAERQRQISGEGWTPEHDDKHSKGEMAEAAACYAASASVPKSFKQLQCPGYWPWAFQWWKPSDARRDLVKAGALILAELERIDRAARKQGGA